MEKNRAAHNLRRRNARKGLKETSTPSTAPARVLPVAGKEATLASLRELVAAAEPVVAVPAKPVVYRDDYGRVITQSQWNKLQEMKMEAKQKGYVIDEFSQ